MAANSAGTFLVLEKFPASGQLPVANAEIAVGGTSERAKPRPF